METELPKNKKFLSPHISKSTTNDIKIMRLISHLNDIKDEKMKDKIVKLYYKQAVNKRFKKRVAYVLQNHMLLKRLIDIKIILIIRKNG